MRGFHTVSKLRQELRKGLSCVGVIFYQQNSGVRRLFAWRSAIVARWWGRNSFRRNGIELKRERRAFVPSIAVRADRPAMHFYNCLGDCQSQTKSAKLLRHARITLL